VQFGVFMPRFSIHFWHDDRTVNEPWMHPKATPFVRDVIKLRYRLIPYLYNLLWRYHHAYEPVVRPTFFDFPDDPHCWREGDEMMVGPSLLAAPVVEPGHVPSRGLSAFRRALVRFLVRRVVQGRPDHYPPGTLDVARSFRTRKLRHPR
jgi:Glycosyl hydrolases family 31